VPIQAGRYLEARRAQRESAQFQAAGYPLGSGIVESANKRVVAARLKGAGRHWARAQVNPLAAFRAVLCSGRGADRRPWDDRRRSIPGAAGQGRGATTPRPQNPKGHPEPALLLRGWSADVAPATC